MVKVLKNITKHRTCTGQLRPKVQVIGRRYERKIKQPQAVVLQKVQVIETIQNGKVIGRKMGDIHLEQLTHDGTVKTTEDPLHYYKRGIDPKRDKDCGLLLSRHTVTVGDVVELILPKRFYDTEKYSQKKIYGVIDWIDAYNQEEDEIGLIIKFHKDHKNTMKDCAGNTRSLNQEWVCVNLSNVKFIKRNAILGKDYIGSLHDTDGYYESLGYTILPPHTLHQFLREWGNREHFLKKN